VVKLSDAVQDLPRSVTQFVHGVPESFLAVGEKKAEPSQDGGQRFTKGAYFIGKARIRTCFQRCALQPSRSPDSKQPDTLPVLGLGMEQLLPLSCLGKSLWCRMDLPRCDLA
jgi:hypothetical protein